MTADSGTEDVTGADGAEHGATPSGPPLPSSTGHVLRTAGLVTAVTTLGSLFGLIRDATIAGTYGASADTDAFMVAWTIPETASPLLLQEALTFLLVPLLSRELVRRGTIQHVVDRTLVPAVALLAALTALIALAAPLITTLLAPGIADPGLATRCVRIAALSVFFLGVAGYLTATLRAVESFLVPAWVPLVYNVGIIGSIAVLAATLGIYAAAIGLVIGSAGMVAVQLLPFLRRASLRRLQFRIDRRVGLALLAFLPVALYTLGRQAQVFVERVIGSGLGPGAISQLNYASKVAQMTILLTSVVAAVAFPALARQAAAGHTEDLRDGVETNLRLGVLLIIPMSAALTVFAPQIIRVLFERGAFSAADTAVTAEIMQVYSTGLLGQTLVLIGVISFFSTGARTWYPALAAGVGLVATVVVGVLATPPLGPAGMALGNSVGITVVAVVLLVGLRRRVDIRFGRIGDVLWRTSAAAGLAVVNGWAATLLLPAGSPDLLVLAVGGSALVAVFLVAAGLLGVAEVQDARRMVTARLGRRSRRRT